ncbi:hypothetical protein V6N13_139533 [Hibiscus sabdariffa]
MAAVEDDMASLSINGGEDDGVQISEELTTVKVRNQLVDSHTGNVTAKESGTSLSHAPSSNVSVGPSNIGPLVHFDTIAVSSSEDDPVRSVDSIKRPRVHSLASLVSDQLDSSDASLCSLTDPKRIEPRILDDHNFVLDKDYSGVSARRVEDMLHSYAKSSGQLVNYEKSSVFFSSNVSLEKQADVCRTLGVSSVINPETYLGLLSIVGRNKNKAFRYLTDRFATRIQWWGSKSLSQGGNDIFLKSVL